MSQQQRSLSAELGESPREESPFAAVARRAGGVPDLRFGVMVPEHFGDPQAEYRAARSEAGLVDLSFRGLLEVQGGERLRWLNGQVTNDVSAMRSGDGRLAAVLDVKGHVLTDLLVHATDAGFLLDLPRDRAVPVHGVLDRRIIADDVTLRNATQEVARLMVLGPRAAEVLEEACGGEPRGLAAWRHQPVRLAGVEAVLAATPWLPVPGFALTLPSHAAAGAWDMLLRTGGARLRPVGMRALEWLRVEAGWPWYGQDVDETCLLTEAYTAEYVSFTKGCYTGQEVVIRIEHQGHVNRKLTGLLITGGVVPSGGTAVLAGSRAVGKITTAVFSPALDRVIALAYVRREHLAPGTRLTAAVEPTPVEAEVTGLPFVTSPR